MKNWMKGALALLVATGSVAATAEPAAARTVVGVSVGTGGYSGYSTSYVGYRDGNYRGDRGYRRDHRRDYRNDRRGYGYRSSYRGDRYGYRGRDHCRTEWRYNRYQGGRTRVRICR